jgi:hypothetical protein
MGLRDVKTVIIFLVLVIVGILIQAKLMEQSEEG